MVCRSCRKAGQRRAQSLSTFHERITMSKRIEAKHKIDRRLRENLWGRPSSPLNARAYGPGQHGQRSKCKTSDYGLQLRAKQKLKGYYGSITEKSFKKLYTEAARIKGDTGERLIGLLESRLDAIVYRAKFVATVFAARQFVSPAHVPYPVQMEPNLVVEFYSR